MKTRALLVALTAAAALTAGAQARKPMMNFTPVSCIRGGELALLQVDVAEKGEVRAYFRRVNTTDWCSVEGINEGPLSRVVLPKFDNGEEIEYFFVLLQGRRVMARSPRMYRSRVSDSCETPFARHVVKISMSCGEDQAGIPSSAGAAMALTDNPNDDFSPFNPDQEQ